MEQFFARRRRELRPTPLRPPWACRRRPAAPETCGCRPAAGAPLAAGSVCRGQTAWLLASAALTLMSVASAEPAEEACATGDKGEEELDGWVVLRYTLVMALARCAPPTPGANVRRESAAPDCAAPIRGSGIGALPFFLIPPDQLKGGLVGAANAVAAGVTLAASFGEPRAFGRPFGRLCD